MIYTISFETVLNLSISLISFFYDEDLMFFLQLLPNVLLFVPLLFPSIFQDISVGTVSPLCVLFHLFRLNQICTSGNIMQQ